MVKENIREERDFLEEGPLKTKEEEEGMFTIEVKQRGKDEEFHFRKLELFHQECYGGRIFTDSLGTRIDVEGEGETKTSISELPVFELTCSRCKRTMWILEQSEAPAEVIKTAIDGQERKISGYQGIIVAIYPTTSSRVIGVQIEATIIQKLNLK